MRLMLILLFATVANAQQPKVQSVASLRDDLKSARATSNKIDAATELARRSLQPKLTAKDKASLREVAVELSTSETEVLRIMAATIIANVGTKDEAATLHELMDDASDRVRGRAYHAAKKVHNDDTPMKVMESFTKYGSPMLGETHPIDTLAAIGTPKARKGLELIYEKGNGSIRERAAKALDDLDKKK